MEKFVMTAPTTALWVVALTALLLLAIPLSLLVREMMTETARDPGQVRLLLVCVALALSVVGFFVLCLSRDLRSSTPRTLHREEEKLWKRRKPTTRRWKRS